MTSRQHAAEIQNCLWAVESLREQRDRAQRELNAKQAELDSAEARAHLKWKAAAFTGMTPDNYKAHLPPPYVNRAKPNTPTT